MKIRIVVIGYGAIAAELIQRLLTKYGVNLSLAVLLRQNSLSAKKIPPQVKYFSNIDALKDFHPDLVVEVAGHQAVREYAKECLQAGISFVAVSVGALAEEQLFSELNAAAIQ